MTASGIVVTINVIMTVILEIVTKMEKNHSQNDETLSKFYKITILQFINYSMLTLIINFKIESMKDFYFLGFIGIFQGKFDDFSADWYEKIGSIMCVTLAINIFSPHFSKLALPILKLLLRWYDTGFRCDLKFTEYKPNQKFWRRCCCK
jgi:hypothetical protein